MLPPTRFRSIVIALSVGAALSAVLAPNAQATSAPFFSITGTRLAAGKTHNIAGHIFPGSSFKWSIPALGVTITCTGLTVENAVLLGSNEGQPGKDNEINKLTGCTVTGNGTPCEPTGGTITTAPMTSELVESVGNGPNGHGKQLLEEFKPATGTTFFVLHFTGSGCTVTEGTVSGTVAAEILTDNSAKEPIELNTTEKEGTSWLVNFPSTPIKEVLLVNAKGETEHVKVKQEAFSFESVQTGTSLVLLASAQCVPENVNWRPAP